MECNVWLLHKYAGEVVVVGVGDLDVVEVADLQSFGFDIYFVVHFVRIVLGAADEVAVFAAVDESLECLADTVGVEVERYALLELHDAVGALFFHGFGDVVGVIFECVGVFFVAVLEYAEAVKFGRLYVLVQFLKFGVGLARMPDEQCCAERDAGHLLANAVDERYGLLLGDVAAHLLEHVGGYVLERYVEIAADVAALAHEREYVLGEVARIGVVQAYPFGAGLVGEHAQEVGQTAFFVQVEAVVRKILRDENQFFGATSDKIFGALEERFHAFAFVLAADERYGTECAGTVATFGQLEVSGVARRGDDAFVEQVALVFGVERLEYFLQVFGTKVAVHLGYFFAEVVGIALAEAADDEQALDEALFLGKAVLEYGVDGFFFGVADKSAGVDDDRFGGLVGVVEHFKAVGVELFHQLFRID